MKTVSIEICHIYTNAYITEEQELSIKALDAIVEPKESLVVLIDDYSFPDPTFDYDGFLAWLTEKGHKPDVVFRESALIPVCDDVLRLLPDSEEKKQLVDYIKAKKYPCSLFVASWYLLRLGKLQHPAFPSEEYSERLINLLPESFKPFEDKAIDIIKLTPYAECAGSIENRYTKGRLIA